VKLEGPLRIPRVSDDVRARTNGRYRYLWHKNLLKLYFYI